MLEQITFTIWYPSSGLMLSWFCLGVLMNLYSIGYAIVHSLGNDWVYRRALIVTLGLSLVWPVLYRYRKHL